MKWYLAIGSLIVIVLAVTALFFFRSAGGPVPSGSTSGTGLPAATSTGATGTSGASVSSSTPASGSQTLTIAAAGGSSVVVNDFLHNGTTSADVANPGNYYLAGSAGYCTADGVCPAGAPAANYAITYNGKSFIVALTKEPLGQARLDAEQFLMRVLNVTETQMCALPYYVGTNVYTNAFYAGKNLGFSFCPGATALPQ